MSDITNDWRLNTMHRADFYTETLFSAMSTMQKDKPKQLNPLLPGYAFDRSEEHTSELQSQR